MAVTWIPLHEAYALVLWHERDRIVATHRLLDALYSRKVLARGCVVSEGADMTTVEPLSRTLFGVETPGVSTTLNVEANSARHVDGWHGVEYMIFRLELAREDLIKLWPDERPRRGRKPKYDHDRILRAADDEIAEGGLPQAQEEFAARVAVRLRDAGVAAPERSQMIEILRPKYTPSLR